ASLHHELRDHRGGRHRPGGPLGGCREAGAGQPGATLSPPVRACRRGRGRPRPPGVEGDRAMVRSHTVASPATSWRRDFGRLWTAETVSSFGSQITTVALPLTAAALLHASPAQMGILAAASTLPGLLLSFHFGAWADRVTRRWSLLVW